MCPVSAYAPSPPTSRPLRRFPPTLHTSTVAPSGPVHYPPFPRTHTPSPHPQSLSIDAQCPISLYPIYLFFPISPPVTFHHTPKNSSITNFFISHNVHALPTQSNRRSIWAVMAICEQALQRTSTLLLLSGSSSRKQKNCCWELGKGNLCILVYSNRETRWINGVNRSGTNKATDTAVQAITRYGMGLRGECFLCAFFCSQGPMASPPSYTTRRRWDKRDGALGGVSQPSTQKATLEGTISCSQSNHNMFASRFN